MPMALPLIGAAGSIFAGATALAGAATIGATIVGGAMIAGGALTAIGALTKNKKLMQIGGIVSLAGGVAGLATGAWSSAASSVASEAAAAPSSVDQLIGGAAQQGLAAAEGISVPATQAAQFGGSLGGIAGAPIPSRLGVEIAGQSTALAPAAPAAQAGVAPMTHEAFRAAELSGGAPGGVSAPAAPAGPATVASPTGWGATLDKVGQWMERNKALTQVGGGIVQGLASSYANQAAAEEAYRQQEEALRRRRAEYSAGIVGLRMPIYVAPKG